MKTAALAFVLGLALTGSPALAQTPAPAPAAVSPGLAISDMSAFLTGQGLSVGAVETAGDQTFVRVQDGPLSWVLFFLSCQNAVCADVQFNTGYAVPGATLEAVNTWNRDHRFLKAFYEAPTAGAATGNAIVQQDVLIHVGQGVEQLGDPLAVWRGLLPAFATAVGAVQTAAPAAQ